MIGMRWRKLLDADVLSVELRCDMADVDGCPRTIGHLNGVLARQDATALGWQCEIGIDLCPTHAGGAR